MLIFSNTITPRLSYVCDFLGTELSGKPFQLTDKKEIFLEYKGTRINYSPEKISGDEFLLQPYPLLFEKGIGLQNIECFELNNNKAFFKTGGDYPFDIFAAIFYLLTRYEEYLPHRDDEYGRYDHKNSIAFRENFLHLPLINIWLYDFKETLKKKFPAIAFISSTFTFLPTYDIDEGFCYQYKPRWKTWGGYCRSVLKGDFWEINERNRVLRGLQKDPYDSLLQIKELQKNYPRLRAIAFFLVAEKSGRYDKNISPLKQEWQKHIKNFIVKDHAGIETGLHPSWQSGNRPGLIKKEKKFLQDIIGSEVQSSRQHYIRFGLPQTCRQLLESGIRSDYSMGYGGINGFRASVASSFYWYDLEKEERTDLVMFPFCFMDANSFFEQKYSPQQALGEMRQYFNQVKAVDGLLITVWHNTFLGSHRRFAGWCEVYEEFLSSTYNQLSPDEYRPG